MKNCQTIILAAGEGKRMKSTKPKVVHPLLGKEMINYVVDSVLMAGSEEIVVVVGHGRKEVEECLEGRPVKIALQKSQLGTGDAVRAGLKCIKRDRKETIILCGDAPLIRGGSLKRLLRLHRREKAAVTLLTGIMENPKGYGRVIRDPGGAIARIVEEKDANREERSVNEVNSGSYVFTTKYLRENIQGLKTDNVQKEYYITDLVYKAFFEGMTVSGYAAKEPDEVMGINSRMDLAVASGILAIRKAEALMERGVTIEDPYNVFIGPDVQVGSDSVIEPGVIIKGNTRVGKRVRVGAGCNIEDSVIQNEVELRPYCVITNARVGTGATVGPFAHLRPEAELKRNVHVGNFVEIKKSVLGEGSKANHLSYIGDAKVGKKVNVGAGTITCNYDGIKKHETEIGDGAFIGSDTQLVAPVKVGKGALVGAGATITEDVPPFSLALSRVEQKNIENWVTRKMPALLEKSGLIFQAKKKKR